VLIKKGAVKQLIKQKTKDINIQAIGIFLISNSC
jgi:hypothetical protein